MEEPKTKPKSKRILILSVLVSIAIIIFTVGLVLSSTWFLSADTPEEPETITETREEHCKRLPNDPICELRKPTIKTEFPDTTYTKEPLTVTSKVVIPLSQQKPVSNEPPHDADNHTHDKVTQIPMTILDMVYFLNDHPELSDQDSGVLMSYAVAKETGMNADEEVDHLAYHIMEKIQ